MKNIHVQAQRDHITSLCTASPIQALTELVWNALDADAFDVKVDVIQNPLGGIESIRVTDDGLGVNALQAEKHFGNLGGSWKRDADKTPLSGRVLHGSKGKGRFKAFLFALGFWGTMGLILPKFYAFQGFLYGNGTDVRTLALKIVTDQFGYTAFFASPAVAISHLWKDRGYRWSAIAPLLGKGWFRRLVVPNLVMNWTIWFPSLCVIYSLPPALQAHVAGLIGGFWALMSLQIAAHTKPGAGSAPAG